MDPKALRVAMLEARALVPKKRSEPGAVAATLHVQEAIDVINKAVEDPEVKPEREVKMALAVPVLEELLDIVTKNGTTTTTDADRSRRRSGTITRRIIDGDPKLQAAATIAAGAVSRGTGRAAQSGRYWSSSIGVRRPSTSSSRRAAHC